MEYVGRVPASPLDRFIDDMYCLTGVPRHRRMNVPPMPSAHLFVNLGGPVRLWDGLWMSGGTLTSRRRHGSPASGQESSSDAGCTPAPSPEITRGARSPVARVRQRCASPWRR